MYFKLQLPSRFMTIALCLVAWGAIDAESADAKQDRDGTSVALESTEGRLSEQHLQHQGRERRYLMYLPAGYMPQKSYPVVLNFHGGMGHAEHQMTVSGMNRVADRYGFLVVYPDGTAKARRLFKRLSNLLTFNAGTCCGYAEKEQVNDVGLSGC